MLQWNASYEVGNRFIDSEHKILFELANEIASKDIDTLAKFKEIYLELIQYTNLHFINEEQLMKDIGFSGFATHVLNHRMIIDQMRKLISQPSPLEELQTSLVSCLSHWITTHILREDMAYRPALVEWKKKRLGL
ncbi:MAG: hypothetical protein RL173_1200 [Fibrobacterota bacterium]|jgi:hemerythrin-like metal-binding protein